MRLVKFLCFTLALFVSCATVINKGAAQSGLKLAVPALPPGLGNPFTTGSIPGVDIYMSMFDGLAELHESGELRPSLATSWEAIDALTWEFKLRQGVRFANGKPFTADTVVQVFEILSTPEAAKWSMIREVNKISAVEAISPTLLRVRTRSPDLMLPARFAALLMVEPDYWRSIGAEEFARLPIGTGPYLVKDWSAQSIELSANTHAWRPGPTPSLDILVVPEPSSRLAALQTDAIDIALFMGPEDISFVEAAGGRVVSHLQGGVMGLSYILVKDTVFSDPRVRQAMTYAVNRKLIADVIFAGETEPATQAASRLTFGYNNDLEGYRFDPDRARMLLAEAGFPDGFSFTADVVTPQPTDALVWQQVAADLAKVGVEMNINTMTFSRYIQGLYQGTWTGEAFGMNYGSLPALDPMIGFQFHSCLWLKPWVCDPQQTDIIERALGEFDRDTRRSLVQELLRITYDEPIGLYLHERARFDAVGRRVAKYRAPFGYTSFHDIELIDE
ncbi:MAG: ABC transporter substrate-binding protein [Rhodospirillaceae bacterium]